AAERGGAGAGPPGGPAAAVRLRQAAGSGGAAARAARGRAPRAHLHADGAHAGRAGGLPQPAGPVLRPAGRVDQARGPAGAGAALQRRPARVLLHPVHALGRRGHEPGGRRHGGVLRLGLEPGHGRPGPGPLPPHRPDSRRAHLSPGDAAHGGGKHFAQVGPEEAAGLSRHPVRRVHHRRAGRQARPPGAARARARG
ncbi:hypothetical protein H632_c5277p0, partial [Helicosporidium sp. ATCC 50920]